MALGICTVVIETIKRKSLPQSSHVYQILDDLYEACTLTINNTSYFSRNSDYYALINNKYPLRKEQPIEYQKSAITSNSNRKIHSKQRKQITKILNAYPVTHRRHKVATLSQKQKRHDRPIRITRNTQLTSIGETKAQSFHEQPQQIKQLQ